MKESNFIHCHLHVAIGSMSDSLLSIDSAFKRAKELGQTAIAITDHGLMSGMFDAHKASKKYGIKFIPGVEAYFIDSVNAAENEEKQKRSHLILLAKNEVGYRNLLSLNYEGFRHAQYVPFLGKMFPQIDWDLIEKYKEGVICLSACSSGVVARQFYAELEAGVDEKVLTNNTILRFQKIYGDDFYLEIQPHELQIFATDRKTGEPVINEKGKQVIRIDQKLYNKYLVEMSKFFGIKLVGTCDVHYLNKEDAKAHDLLQSVLEKKPLSDKTRHRYGVDEFYLKSYQEVHSYFESTFGKRVANEACRTTMEIADKCEDSNYLAPSGLRFPKFNVEQEQDYQEFLNWKQFDTSGKVPMDFQYLRYKVQKSFQENFKHLSTTDKGIYIDRIKKEVAVLEMHNFSSYMLIVSDFIKQARKNGVRIGPGRGSVAGSLVAYLLDIHSVNPMQYDLLFERFHNKEKKSFPDIDTDIDPIGRNWVENYIVGKYGARNVAHVSNLSRMTPKVTIKDIARSLEIGGSRSEAFKIANKITDTISKDAHTIDEALQQSKEFSEYCAKYPELEAFGRKLVGLEKLFSSHAAGIVIGDIDLSTFVPLRIDKNGIISVQYEKNRCEEMGLIKMDLLGLEHLLIIDNTIKNAKKLGMNCPEPENIPLDDKNVWMDIAKGNTIGVFQMSSPHMTELCKKIKPKCIEDLSLVNALGRPSAAHSRDIYIQRRDKKAVTEYKYDCLREPLKDTLGIVVYEEQLMRIGSMVAGWDLNRSDNFRKLSKYKNKDPKFVEKLRSDFINDACSFSKLKHVEAVDIWDNIIEPISHYSFNLSHSIAYSINGYHTAYYKHYFPAAFLTAVLKSEASGNGADRDSNIRAYKKEARRLGISIVPPDINKCEESFSVVDKNTILIGLTAIKGLGTSAAQSIFKARNEHLFTSFADFLYRTESSKVKKDSIQALAQAGAFDSLGITRRAAFTYYQDIRQKANKYGDNNASHGIKSYYCLDGFEFDRDDFYDEWDRPELLKAENDSLGEYISGGVSEVYGNFFTSSGTTFDRAKSMPDKAQLKVEAILLELTEATFKSGKNKGKIYARGVVSDVNGETMNITIWNEQYLKSKSILSVGKPFKGICSINEWNGAKGLVLNKAT